MDGLGDLGSLLCVLSDFYRFLKNFCILFSLRCSWFCLRKVSREWLILRLLVQTHARRGNGPETVVSVLSSRPVVEAPC